MGVIGDAAEVRYYDVGFWSSVDKEEMWEFSDNGFAGIFTSITCTHLSGIGFFTVALWN